MMIDPPILEFPTFVLVVVPIVEIGLLVVEGLIVVVDVEEETFIVPLINVNTEVYFVPDKTLILIALPPY